MAQQQNNSGSKTAFIVLAALLSIITGVYAMVEPMGQRIDFLERSLATNVVYIDRHISMPGHMESIERIAGLSARLARMEKDLDMLRDSIRRLETMP
jgi:hypothetical protein